MIELDNMRDTKFNTY